MNATPTPTPVEFQNATSSFTSGFGDMGGLVGPLFIFGIYAIGALLAAQFLAPWLAKSSLLGRAGDAVLTAIGYAMKGLASVAVLGLIAAPAYLAMTVDASTRGAAARWVGYGIAAFAGLVVVGWLADRAVARYVRAHPTAESWGDLWTDGEGREPVADGGTLDE